MSVTTRTRLPRVGVLVSALLAYVPALLARPGQMPADTKLFLYLDAGRLIGDAPYTWDTRQFAGWVPHQTFAYLWPQGPWYWLCDHLGLPVWVAHRLWLGTLLFLGGLGVLWLAGVLGLRADHDCTRPANRRGRGLRGLGAGAMVAALGYQLSPYILAYVSRTSAMLLPWVALPWMIGLTIRIATGRTPWRHACVFALILFSCVAVNATAVLMIAPGPVLWLIHAVVSRTITWRRALSSAARIAALGVLVSLASVWMLRVQGTYGADVLGYSESLQATSATSTSFEAWRSLGYWLFYVHDPYAYTTTASQHYVASGLGIAISVLVTLIGMAGLAIVRWSQRRFAVLLVGAGIVLAVGVHPIDNPSPVMSALAGNSRSALALALRSSARAVPLSALGLALGFGALVGTVAERIRRSEHSGAGRIGAGRFGAGRIGAGRLGAGRRRADLLLTVVASLLLVANLPALFDGGLVDPALARQQYPPAAWEQAAAALSAGSSEYRVLQLPGSEFGAFRWGYTVDPPLPGLTTKPLVTRDLLPLGSPGAMDLLYALDDRVQNGTFERASLAATARYLGVDTVWLANDLAFERFRTPRPSAFAKLFATAGDGLGMPVGYGVASVNTPSVAMLDEHALAAADTAVAPVELVPVTDAQPIVRVRTGVVVLAGSGDGIVDAAAAGLIDGSHGVIYAADEPAAAAAAGTAITPAMVILTDTNRDRAHQWRSSQDVTGFTESGGADGGITQLDDADRRLPVFGEHPSTDTQTIATLEDGLQVRASGYGEPFAYRPEDRPAMAVDGDPSTTWVVGDRLNPVGQTLHLSSTDGELRLLQPPASGPTRMITRVTVTTDSAAGAPITVELGEESLRAPGHTVAVPAGTGVTIRIGAVGERPGGTDSGLSPVGFAEVLPSAHREIVRVPLLGDAAPQAGTPLAIVLTRERVDPLNRWRSDPETSIVRQFTTTDRRAMHLTVTLRRNDRASDAALDHLAGITGPTSNRRLAGSPQAWARAAFDGDTTTAWTSPFGQAVGSILTVPTDGSAVTGLSTLTLHQPADEEHSRITRLRIADADGTQDVAVPASTDGVATLNLDRPLRGTQIQIEVTGVDARTTIDRRYGERVQLPVAIQEFSVPAQISTTSTPTGCTGAIVVDGKQIGIEVDATALAAGETVQATTCDGAPVELAAGTHVITAGAPAGDGYQIDRVVLSDAPAGTATAAAASGTAPAAQVVRTRTERRVLVDACPTGCWLVLGEGYNAGWQATTQGGSLGAPVQLDGGFNGWWLAPSASATLVELTWTPQRGADVMLAVSLLAVLSCLVVAVAGGWWSRRRGTAVAAAPWTATPPALDGSVMAVASRRVAVGAAAVAVALAALVGSPTTAVVALVPAALVVLFRRPRLAGVLAVALVAALGARVGWSQIQSRWPADGAWPSHWERVHRLGMLAVALLAAGALGGDARADGPADAPADAPVSPVPAAETAEAG